MPPKKKSYGKSKMNPESKEFVAAGNKNGSSAPSTHAPSTQAQQESSEVTEHPWPIPSIVVTPFVNQLPSDKELLGQKPNNTPGNAMVKYRPQDQTARPASGMSLMLPGMSASNSGSPVTRQMAGEDSVIGSPAGGMSLMTPGMSSSSTGSPGARQMAGGNSLIESPASQHLMEFEDNSGNTTPTPFSMSAAYGQGQGQGQAGQHSYMASFAPQPGPTTQPPRTSGSILKSNLFNALASRAYQEAVKLPETPPPAGWVPGEPLEVYYEELLMRFQVIFGKILRAQGCYDESTFRDEWLHHCHNIMENLNKEWDLHPFGSVGGIKTTLPTKNAMAATLAIRSAAEKPTVPPPADWKVGDELHPYYESMLARFERHLAPMVEGRRLPVFEDPAQLRHAIDEYSMFIIREFRVTWFEMFGQ